MDAWLRKRFLELLSSDLARDPDELMRMEELSHGGALYIAQPPGTLLWPLERACWQMTRFVAPFDLRGASGSMIASMDPSR